MEIKGNVNQINGNQSNFYCSSYHTVILNGTKQQVVHFDSSSSRFNNLELKNSNVIFDSSIVGWTLQEDTTLGNGLENGMSGTFNLNGHKLIINGNLYQSDGRIDINGGALEVHGDYRIQEYRYDSTTEKMVFTTSAGCIEMNQASDRVSIDGDFIVQTDKGQYVSTNTFTAGVMEIKGNVKQINGNQSNFYCSNYHTVVLNGINNVQKVSFDSTSSHFNNLKLTKDKETGYILNPDNCWNTLYLDTDIASVSVTADKTTVKQASSLQLYSKVNGINVPSQEVTWSVSGNIDNDTSISDKGVLTVGLNENAEKLTITAVSVAEPTKSASIDISVEKLQRVVFGVFVTPSTVSLIGGESCTFSAFVYGLFSPSQEVTWTVSGNKSRNTKISADGLLTVGKDETAERLTIKATSVLDKTKSASVTVDIYQIKIVSTVSSVTVTMEPGEKQQLMVVVTGTNNPNQAVTWSVSGNNSKNTTVSTTGLVSIAEDETADMIVVRATSVDDTDKYGEFAINITPKATYILGDLDGDGEIMVTDATFIQRHLVNIPIPFEFNEKAADADGDGIVTLMDATYIQRWLANLKANDNIGKPISK